MHRHFVFLRVSAQSVKVSQGPFVGLPSVTGLTGLARAFAISLAKAKGLGPGELQPDGIGLGVEDYEMHAGYVKTMKEGVATPEAVPAIWASFTASFVIRLRGATPRGIELLTTQKLSGDAASVLTELRLCKGRLVVQRPAANLATPRLVERHPAELARAMALLPSRALVLRDESALVQAARTAGLPLMDTLLAATLRHDQRPRPYRDFYEEHGFERRRIYPVTSGYLALESEPSQRSVRLFSDGLLGASRVASPMYTLAALQTAASIRAGVDAAQAEPGYRVLWKEQPVDGSYVCTALA
ncbi:hypothetical protein [Azohydromonas australica]|uniref:hypothetical protein n=1 Tax=Azohydromonas australica TaxID=364039 RepID=UPI0003F6F049|nr:hypothetical protein [Azohydromonas australica]